VGNSKVHGLFLFLRAVEISEALFIRERLLLFVKHPGPEDQALVYPWKGLFYFKSVQV
jgi:hypothetical protein